ncbi:MAG: glycogen/starch synthase, partial [Puniceicoccales bacterium]|nr:glycogen/starch synthase [Puniceicoccales bacterium]
MVGLLNILMVTSEAAPFAKMGGLGDVVASLAASLASLRNDVRVLLPYYSTISEQFRRNFRPIPAVFTVHLAQDHWARLWEYVTPEKVHFYFLEYDKYYGRRGIYGDNSGEFVDNAQRFAFLSA